MVPDRFIVYGDRYRNIREEVAKSVLSSSSVEIAAAFEVRLQLNLEPISCGRKSVNTHVLAGNRLHWLRV